MIMTDLIANLSFPFCCVVYLIGCLVDYGISTWYFVVVGIAVLVVAVASVAPELVAANLKTKIETNTFLKTTDHVSMFREYSGGPKKVIV